MLLCISLRRMINGLKKKLAYFFLSKANSTHEQRPMLNVHDAKSVLVVYAYRNEIEFAEAQKVVKLFQSETGAKLVDFVIYADVSKKKVENDEITVPKNALLLTKNDVNFYYRPKVEVTNTVVGEQYDLVVDISTQPCLPLSFLASRVKAVTKVGRKHDIPDIFDFTLDMKSSDSVTEFTKQVLNYMSIINKKTA